MGVTFQGPKKYPHHRRVPAAPVCARAWRAIVRHAGRLVALLPVAPPTGLRAVPPARRRRAPRPIRRTAFLVVRVPESLRSSSRPRSLASMTTSEDAAAAGPPRPPRDTPAEVPGRSPQTPDGARGGGRATSTRPGLFARVLAPVYRAGTLDELRVRCLEANAVLSSPTDIFDRVDILCDAGPEEHPDTADVVVEVVEKKKLNLKGGAYVSQSGEGSMEMSAGLNNALGFAEKLDVEMIRGHERSSTYVLAWNQPRVWNRDVDVVTRAFQQVSCSKRLSSFDETARGVSVTAVGGVPRRSSTSSPCEISPIPDSRPAPSDTSSARP